MSRIINTTIATTTYRTSATNAFLADARRYELLSEEEIVNLISKAKQGDIVAQNKIVNHNLRFIFSLCNCFAKGDEVLDLVSLATIGMIKAIDSFDATRGFKFLSYAVHYMRLEISEYFRTTAPMIEVTNSAKIGSKAKKIADKFYQQEMRMPSEEEIIDLLDSEYGIKINDKRDVMNANVSSINEQIGEEGETAEEIGEVAMLTASTNDYEEIENEEYDKRIVNLFLSTLSVRDANIMKMIFGVCEWKDNPQTEESVAEKYG